MKKIIQILLIIVLLIAIVIGVFIIKGIMSGNLSSYVAKTAVEVIAPDATLSPEQQEMLDSGDYESLAKDIEENITPEQSACAVEILGVERAKELMITKDPTPQEILKLSKCL